MYAKEKASYSFEFANCEVAGCPLPDLHVHDEPHADAALSLLYAAIAPFLSPRYITLPEVAFARSDGRFACVMRKRGHVVTGAGDAVKVSVEVARTDPLAFEVAVRVSVSGVRS